MTKNIVIYSDGTGQVGGLKPDQRLSNIYKMFRATRVSPGNKINPTNQVAFYDAGLGTEEGTTGISGSVKLVRKLLGSITGRGITTNIIDCYEAILNNYNEGDRIFLFGFSRGAYTARCVANVVTLLGVPTTNAEGAQIRKFSPETRAIASEAVSKIYEHGAGHPRAKFEAERDQKAARFREKYNCDDGGLSNVVPYFVGVFDTVAALGAKGILRFVLSILFFAIWLSAIFAISALINYLVGWDTHAVAILLTVLSLVMLVIGWMKSSFKFIGNYPKKWRFRFHFAKWKVENYDRGLSDRVEFGRHAISIDESRKNFPNVAWGFKNGNYERPGQPHGLKQIWFAGNHSDIGGSYPEAESRLSDIALEWMLEETQAVAHKLIIDTKNLNLFPQASGMQHSEVQSVLDKYPSWWPKILKLTWGEKSRRVTGLLHPTVAERFSLDGVLHSGTYQVYRPQNLRKHPDFEDLYN